MPELRQYQKDAVRFILVNKAAYLAIDRGLGKTAIAITAARKLQLPTMVLCPPKVALMTWPDEIKKWWPEATYTIFHGPKKASRLKLKKDFYIIPYSSVKWFYTQAALGNFPMRRFFMVYDESSFVKNHSTDRFKKYLAKMYPIWSQYRVCLSATPSPNGLHQLWPQYYLLDKGKALGQTYTSYRDKYFIYYGPPRFQTKILPFADQDIHKLVKPMTFRLENKHFDFMPDVTYSAVRIPMPLSLAKMYKKLEKDFVMDWGNGDVVTTSDAGGTSNKLRQVMQGAVYIDKKDPFDKSPKKYKIIHDIKANILKEIVEGAAGQPILCAINFRFERDMINTVFKQDVPCIAGGVSTSKQLDFMRKWNRGELPLLLCHPASIGHGMNLQFGGNHILWYSLTWDLELYIQLIGRLARSGQSKKKVVSNHIIFKGTIDDRLYSVLSKKDLTQQEFLDAMKGGDTYVED